jgi:hypothetical protein
MIQNVKSNFRIGDMRKIDHDELNREWETKGSIDYADGHTVGIVRFDENIGILKFQI